MREVKFINRNWLYKGEFNKEYLQNDFSYAKFEDIELPHSNKILPLNCFNEEEYAFISTYVKKIKIDEKYYGKSVFLDFEGVMIAAEVYCNGVLVGGHEGGYTFFEVELTDYLKYGQENTIVVKVDSRERKDIPPYGKVVDYLTFGGIYREVSLRIVEKTYIDTAFIKTFNCLEEERVLEIEAKIKNLDLKKIDVNILLLERNNKIEIASKKEKVSLKKGENLKKFTLKNLRGLKLWDIENPNLYEVKIQVLNKGEKIDEIKERVGFREAKFKEDGFFLNGKKVKIIGLNRHQSYPYVGYAMPKRVQEKDVEILKNDLAINLVRCSHYPQSKHFLNRCDELGLLVFEEIPGWQHLGDESWQEKIKNSVKEMIIRDFNHPSIILWGVRVNESRDNYKLYKETNEIAHRIDSTRQTGGVRDKLKSELLEDVYTFNDFIHDGGEVILREKKDVVPNIKVPYLVTENNGHIYPTKIFDHEAKVVEHAHRHLRVIDEVLKREDLAGNISWCAFDYNTHSAFGSGDKICYHGVCDMFRIRKYAAESYRFQKSPKKEVILEVISNIARGERDKGGIVPFDIFTNCDYIMLYKNNQFIDVFSGANSKLYRNLKYKPIRISSLLPKKVDFKLNEDEEKFKKFIFEKIENGEFFNLSREDKNYAEDIILKHKQNINEIFGVIAAATGGWGDNANLIKIEGYIKDKLVIEKTLGEMKSMNRISIKADSNKLISDAESYDCTRVEISILDEFGNKMKFSNEVINIRVEGVGELIGPRMLPLYSGSTAFWIKTIGKKGEIKIKVDSNYFSCEEKLDVI